MQKYDKALNSWTKNLPEDQITGMVNFSVGFSKEVRKQCLENNIMFFDTGYNQREVLDEIYKKDIVDISSNNNCIYIKKYIAKTPTEAEINDYIENIELYKKFIDTLK